MNRLTIEEVDALRNGIFKPGGVVHVPENFRAYPDIVKMLEMCGKVTQQLADTMRENERLREALEHYKYADDGACQLLAGFKATPDMEDPNSIAGQALRNKDLPHG